MADGGCNHGDSVNLSGGSSIHRNGARVQSAEAVEVVRGDHRGMRAVRSRLWFCKKIKSGNSTFLVYKLFSLVESLNLSRFVIRIEASLTDQLETRRVTHFDRE